MNHKSQTSEMGLRDIGYIIQTRIQKGNRKCDDRYTNMKEEREETNAGLNNLLASNIFETS